MPNKSRIKDDSKTQSPVVPPKPVYREKKPYDPVGEFDTFAGDLSTGEDATTASAKPVPVERDVPPVDESTFIIDAYMDGETIVPHHSPIGSGSEGDDTPELVAEVEGGSSKDGSAEDFSSSSQEDDSESASDDDPEVVRRQVVTPEPSKDGRVYEIADDSTGDKSSEAIAGDVPPAPASDEADKQTRPRSGIEGSGSVGTFGQHLPEEDNKKVMKARREHEELEAKESQTPARMDDTGSDKETSSASAGDGEDSVGSAGDSHDVGAVALEDATESSTEPTLDDLINSAVLLVDTARVATEDYLRENGHTTLNKVAGWVGEPVIDLYIGRLLAYITTRFNLCFLRGTKRAVQLVKTLSDDRFESDTFKQPGRYARPVKAVGGFFAKPFVSNDKPNVKLFKAKVLLMQLEALDAVIDQNLWDDKGNKKGWHKAPRRLHKKLLDSIAQEENADVEFTFTAGNVAVPHGTGDNLVTKKDAIHSHIDALRDQLAEAFLQESIQSAGAKIPSILGKRKMNKVDEETTLSLEDYELKGEEANNLKKAITDLKGSLCRAYNHPYFGNNALKVFEKGERRIDKMLQRATKQAAKEVYEDYTASKTAAPAG